MKTHCKTYVLFNIIFLTFFAGTIEVVSASGESTKSAVLEEHVVGTWEYPGGEASPMQMTFKENNELVFEYGFTFYNPARWDVHQEMDELWITINIAKGHDDRVFQYQLAKGRIKSFDENAGIVIYHFDMNTKTLDFSGWTYTKKE
jgi:hypothetical protein